MKHQKQGVDGQALMFKTKYESLQEILNQIKPIGQQIQSTEQTELAELQNSNMNNQNLDGSSQIILHQQISS